MNIKLRYILILFAVIYCYTSYAGGPPPPPGGGVGPGCWPPPCNPIPIDGGITFIIAAGALLGGRKIYKMNTTIKG